MSHQAQHDGGVCTNVPLLTPAGTTSLALANELAISNPVELEEKIKKNGKKQVFKMTLWMERGVLLWEEAQSQTLMVDVPFSSISVW